MHNDGVWVHWEACGIEWWDFLIDMMVLWRRRSASCEKGDVIPPITIGRMSVGSHQSQTLPSMSTGEGRSSIHMEPSTPQGQVTSFGQPSDKSPLPQPQVRHQHQWRQGEDPNLDDDQGTSHEPILLIFSRRDANASRLPHNPSKAQDILKIKMWWDSTV